METLDVFVIGALELAQTSVTADDLTRFLPADHVFLEIWPEVQDQSILHPLQALNIVDRVEASLELNGDLVECGVFQGATSVLIARLLQVHGSDKKLFLFDSFAGFPEPDRTVDKSARFQKGGWACAREQVEMRLAEHGVTDRCILHEGWFSDTLPELADEQKFCFAYLDADLYGSTVDCLTNLWPRLPEGSSIVCDDYHHPSGGVRKALDEWVADTGEIIHVGPVSQCFVVRGETDNAGGSEPLRIEVRPGKFISLSFDYLRHNALFVEMMERRTSYVRNYYGLFDRFAGLVEGKGPSG